MGKKNKKDELWDDSALIKAFDDGISGFLRKHDPESQNRSADESNVDSSKDLITFDDQTNDGGRDADENKMPSISEEIKESGNESTLNETSHLESEAPACHVGSSTGQYSDHEHTGYPSCKSIEEYYQLLNKFYELEDQRLKILLQLNQFGYRNLNPLATGFTYQEPQASNSEAYPMATSSSCPHGCQSWVTPCTSCPSCCLCGSINAPAQVASTRNTKSTGATDFVKTAMVAAERAINSFKGPAHTNSVDSANEVAAGQEKQLETDPSLEEKSTSSETDFDVILNAWYSAGFQTGKYVTEQYYANGGRG